MLFIIWCITCGIGVFSVNAESWDKYCKCWEENARYNEYSRIKRCLKGVYKDEQGEEPRYTDEQAKECWKVETQPVSSSTFRFKSNTPLCRSIRIYDASKKVLKDIRDLRFPRVPSIIHIIKFLFKFIGAGEPCQTWINAQDTQKIELDEIYTALNIKKGPSGGRQANGEENCDSFKDQVAPKLVPWEAKRPKELFSLVAQVCKKNKMPESCTYLLIFHIADVYVTNKDVETHQSLCDAFRLLLIYYDLTLASENVYTQSVPQQARSKVLQRTLKSMADIINKFGLKEKRLRVYYETLDPGLKYNWFRLVNSFCNKNSARQEDTTKPLLCNYFPTLQQFVESWRTLKTKVPIIDTELDYKMFLKIEDIKQHADTKFGQLGGYFAKLESFDRQKAGHYKDYANDQLKGFNKTLNVLQETVGKNLGELVGNAIASASANLVEKTAVMTFAVCLAANPFAAAKGPAMQAAEQFSLALPQVSRATKLNSLLAGIIKEAKDIQVGFIKNKETLDRAASFLNKKTNLDYSLDDSVDDYLNEYGDFNPGVNRGDIEKVKQDFLMIVNEACAILGETQGNPASTVFMAKSSKAGHCTRTKSDTKRLGVLLLDIYDFQRTYLECTASYLRAKLGEQNAKLLGTRAGNTPVDGLDIKSKINLRTLAYKIGVYSIIYKYCNVLEYKNCGEVPEECTEDIPDITTLKGRKIKNRQEFTYFINIPDSAQITSESTIDAKSLFEGKEVFLTIPDYDWLVKYGGFPPEISDIPVYVKKFVVFLPTLSNRRSIASTGKLHGVHSLYPDRRRNYTLAKTFSRDLHFKLFNSGVQCSKRKKDNPYTLWENSPLPQLCPQSEFYNGKCDDSLNTIPYPSIYGTWSFKVTPDESRETIIPATQLSIKALLVVCRPNECNKAEVKTAKKEEEEPISKEYLRPTTEGGQQAAPNPQIEPKIELRPKIPCEGNKYWNAANNACEMCPDNSTPKLRGYFCAFNQEVVKKFLNIVTTTSQQPA